MVMYRVGYNPLPYKNRKIQKPLNGGLNNGFDVFSIKENEFSECLNISSRNYPAISPSVPRRKIEDITGTPYCLKTRQDDSLMIVNGTSWQEYDGTFTLLETLTASARADTVDFLGGITILVNGTDRKAYDGATVTDITEMPNTDLVAVYGNRVFAASTQDQELHFSAITDYTDWTTVDNSGTIQVLTDNNQPCSGLVSYADHIVYFKRNSIHELYGIAPYNFQMMTLSESVGCIDPRAIVEVDKMLYFMWDDGVYVYNGGQPPQKISYPFIDAYIKELDVDNDIVFGADERRVYMSFYLNDGTNKLIVYDTEIRLFYEETPVKSAGMTLWNQELYTLDIDGANCDLQEMIPDDFYSVPTWSLITKAFDKKSLSSKLAVYKILASVELASGSSLEILISSTYDQDDFVSVGSVTNSGSYDNVQKFFVPPDFTRNMDWARIKVTGTGDCRFFTMELNTRVKPDNF